MKTKQDQYALAIIAAISNLFDDENEYHIDIEELEEGNNLTDFIYSLANVMPSYFYNRITGEEVNTLEFNHIANKLCFQYIKRTE